MCQPSALSACISCHRAIQVQSSGVPFLSRLGRGCPRSEKPSQNGEMPGAGCGDKVRCRKPAGPSLQAEVREAEESPQRAPELRRERAGGAGSAGEVARWQGRQGLQFSTEEASGGLASGKGRGRTAPVRRRTLPVCSASGRPPRWLVWAPPRSSCLRLSSSSGTA